MPKGSNPLSILGFGCMRFPEHSLGRIDEKKALPLLYRAVEGGINYFDTAYPYHMGNSEAFLGKAFERQYRDKALIATKLPHWSVHLPEDLERIFMQQLRDLRRDHMDFYLLHNINRVSWNKLKRLGVLEWMDGLKAAGAVRSLGFSFHASFEEFQEIIQDYPWDFCQIQYNYLDVENQAGRRGLEYAASKDLGVVVMGPLRGGNLAKEPPGEIAGLWQETETKRTPAEWGLRWVWDHPEVTTVLSGMSRLEEVEENLRMAGEAHPRSLSEGEREMLAETRAIYLNLMPVACTGCRYCIPCPHGVNIPLCFEHYNTFKLFKNPRAKFSYTSMLGGAVDGAPGLASQCVNCGACLPKCPQKLDIPGLLQETAATMEGLYTKPLTWLIRQFFRFQRRKSSSGRGA
jgi:predicted aldo/keto reductase-like oxidoreductase